MKISFDPIGVYYIDDGESIACLAPAEALAFAAQLDEVRALVESLHGVVESYNVLMEIVPSGVAQDVIRGAFLGEIDRATERLKLFKESQ